MCSTTGANASTAGRDSRCFEIDRRARRRKRRSRQRAIHIKHGYSAIGTQTGFTTSGRRKSRERTDVSQSWDRLSASPQRPAGVTNVGLRRSVDDESFRAEVINFVRPYKDRSLLLWHIAFFMDLCLIGRCDDFMCTKSEEARAFVYANRLELYVKDLTEFDASMVQGDRNWNANEARLRDQNPTSRHNAQEDNDRYRPRSETRRSTSAHSSRSASPSPFFYAPSPPS
jgi:hypothetical protein